ncbi:hypothetical protein [Pseudomonas lini]|uniref:hypothetical protein n=1 Tax=Pseudomonas lini TaxID=163011 RepID=UPI00345EBC53
MDTPPITRNTAWHCKRFDSSAEALRDERSLPVYVDGWLRGIHQQHDREKELD